MASYDWRLEMENMLAAFNRQAIHSLSIIKLAFNRNGLSFTPEFKKHFMQTSTNCINEAYDQFQVNLSLKRQLSSRLNTVAIMSPRNCPNAVEYQTDGRENYTSNGNESDWITNAWDSVVQIDDSGHDKVVIETVETKPTEDKTVAENGAKSNANAYKFESLMVYTSMDGSMGTDELHGINESMYQSNTNESDIVDPEASNDLNFAVEMDESNDSIEMVEKQSDLTDADDDELSPVHVVANRLNETTSSGLIESKSKTKQLNRKNSYKKRMITMTGTHIDLVSVASKGEKSPPKRLNQKNPKKCTLCGYISRMGHLNRHMRIHTGEKPHRCDHCGRRFANTKCLMKHAATHIAEFPFHCRACFHGFSLKAEATHHEKQCQKRHFECHLCKKLVTFVKTELIIHLRKHNGDKPFRCEICMKHFFQKSNLKRHLNTVHSRVIH